MKRLAQVLACASVVTGCSPSHPTASGAQRVVASGVSGTLASQAKPPECLLAPDAAFVTEGSQAVTLRKFAGQVVVLNLWAPWCNPCVREMPSLNALAGRAPETLRRDPSASQAQVMSVSDSNIGR